MSALGRRLRQAGPPSKAAAQGRRRRVVASSHASLPCSTSRARNASARAAPGVAFTLGGLAPAAAVRVDGVLSGPSTITASEIVIVP